MTIPAAISPVLSELRVGTEDLHKAIEGVMPMFRSDFDLEQYRIILTKFYGFHAAFENVICQRMSGQKSALAYEERKKLALLRKDLSFFHSAEEISELPKIDNLPDYDELSEILGALYVIEGSTLGGQVITTHLQKLGVPQEARNYFSGYGPLTGKMWKQFQAELSHQVKAPEQIEKSVRAARQTFSRLHEWLAA